MIAKRGTTRGSLKETKEHLGDRDNKGS